MQRGDDLLGLDVEDPTSSGKKKSEMTFAERNAATQRRNEAEGLAKKQAVEAAAKEKAKHDVGAHDGAGFEAALTRKYGNLLRAWTLALDIDGSGSIGFTEFCTAVRAQGFAGSLKDLWKEYDKDGEGFISMDEFCPEIAALMSSFKSFLKEKHEGSLVKAWKKSLDLDKSGSIKKDELVEAMKKLGWDGDAARVYSLLDFDHGGSVTLEEIDPKAAQAMARGDDELGLDVEDDKKAADMRGMTFLE